MSDQVVVPDKMVPHNIEAEQAVLGALLITAHYFSTNDNALAAVINFVTEALAESEAGLAEVIRTGDSGNERRQ